MARLFNNIDDYKKYVSVNVNLEMESLAPAISYSIDMYILPALGKTQLQDLETAFTNNVFTTNQTNLLVKVQSALANFSFYEYLPMAEVQVSESGVLRHENGQMKTAYQNQVKTLRQSTKERGYNYLESLFEFLEVNESNYPFWVSSDAYTKNKELFINTAKEFIRHYPIMRGRETFRVLIPVISDVEMFYILPAIGQSFFDYLKNKIATKGSLSFKEKMVLNLIRKAVSNFTISDASQQGWVKFVSNGVIYQEQNSTSFEVVEKTGKNEQVSIKIRKATEIGYKYIDKLKEFLKVNSSDFPSFQNDASINSPIDDCGCDIRGFSERKNTGGLFSM